VKKQKFNFPLGPVVGLLIISLAFLFIMGYIWRVLTTADFFAVKQILVRNSDFQFDYLKGRNIFSLKLEQEARRAYLKCPDCRKVRLTRVLPNSLVVDFLKRKPVALVNFYRDFAIDEQGFLFEPDQTTQGLELPVIYGLETKIFAPRAGVNYRRLEFSIALSIIKEFKANRAFSGFSLKRIDVANPGSAGFFILLPPASGQGQALAGLAPPGLEVRTGLSNIRQKMIILGGLLQQERREWGNIKYIDLRFKEPLIKLNNVK
jgi:cell division septal protein FtsQ